LETIEFTVVNSHLNQFIFNATAMKRFSLPTLIILSILFSRAIATGQTVQWASKVIEFSSELTAIQYSAQQALGKPNILPAGGDNPNAWTPDKPNRKEFIKLGFATPIVIQQIAVAESWNPTALYRILAYDVAGKEYVIISLNPSTLPLKSRIINIIIQPTQFKVAALKLEFDGAAVSGHFGIDAVAISDSNFPIIADIPLAESLAAGINVEQLNKNVNSEFKELNPLLSPDGKTMYFSRRNHPENIGGTKDAEDIWYSEMDANGRWTIARNLVQLNNDAPNFINTISPTPDGKSILALIGNKPSPDGKKTVAGVSMSSLVGGKWTKPVALNIVNDYNMDDHANYFMTNNRKTLLMSVQRADTRGDRDLYVSFMQDDSVWTEPMNLGETVNTLAEESAPFLAMDDKTLYFGSKGFSGYGGVDIYMSKKLDDTWTRWSTPVNMGKTINSEFDDQYFNIPGNSVDSYYSRGTSSSDMDIFRVQLPPELAPELWVSISGKLVDAKTDKPIGAKLVYERLPDGRDMGITQSDPATGEYHIKLPIGYNYSMHAEAKDHISESQNLDLRNYKRDLKETVDFRLRPIEIVRIEEDAVVGLNSIFFDFNKAVLKAESFPELDRVVQLMGRRPQMTIEVDGHTDNVGSQKINLKLSEKRARAVKDYFLSKGVSAARVMSKGFGETRPIVSNDDEKDGRELNRRVEFKIMKL
jgi:OmpA-OmpF porin, OOP family